MEFIEKVKKLRMEIDGISQLVKELKSIPSCGDFFCKEEYCLDGLVSSEQIKKSYDSLILAKAWLGKVLKKLGTESPYKNDGIRKTIKNIEPTADIQRNFSNDLEGKDINKLSYIEKIDWIRQQIEIIIQKGSSIYDSTTSITTKENSFLADNIHRYLSEARFWLGFELGRVRDNEG